MAIKNFKTIAVAGTFTGINSIEIPIFLQFVPSYFIVRSLNYILTNNNQTNSISNILLLKSSIYNNDTIVSLTGFGGSKTINSGRIELKLKYKLNQTTINGNYNFSLTDKNGGIPNLINDLILEFALTLEFIEEDNK